MNQAPTPDEVAAEAEKGNEPFSLGDAARMNRLDPGIAEEAATDPPRGEEGARER